MADSLDIPCPECGDKVGVRLRKNETRREIETTCPGCGTQFPIGLDVIHQAVEKQAKALAKDIEKINRQSKRR